LKKILRSLYYLILKKFDLVFDYLYDLKRYKKFSMKNGIPISDQQLKFRLLQRAHSFEKGLSLTSVKPLFGKDKLRELITLIKEHEKRKMPKSGIEIRKAFTALNSYLDFHKKQSIDVFEEFDFLEGYNEFNYNNFQSIKNVTRKELESLAKGDFEQLVNSRFSARQFTSREVSLKVIEEAVLLARQTPSVCNRQSGHIFVISDDKLKKRALEIQAGNAGFGDEVNKVLVITASLESFSGARERNQVYIDGGLFAMSVIYALHFKGLAVCPLNWSSGRKKDLNFRKVINIPKEHVIIMLLAVGHHKDEYPVASSPRRDLKEIFNIID
jgi:nitroreductase